MRLKPMPPGEKAPRPAAAPATERERAVLDWMFRNTRSCPFADGCGLDFDAECRGFGTDGCRECVLKNIVRYGNKPE